MLAISLTSHLAALPTNWGSVTLAQAAAIAVLGEEATIQDCLAVLLNCSGAEVLSIAPKHLSRALSAVLFLSEPLPSRESWERPTVLFLGGSLNSVEVPVLDTLEDLTFGQAADIGALIQEFGEDVAQLRIKVLATILQPAYDGTPYDTDRVALVEALCGSVKLREALPLTDFFLPTSTASDEPTPLTSSGFPSAQPSEAPTLGSSAWSGIPSP